MANPTGKGLKPCKPGETNNPNGRPKDPIELHMMKQMNRSEIKILLNKILLANPQELDNFRGTVLEIWLASSISKAIKAGNMTFLLELLERLFPGGLEDEAGDELRRLLSMSQDEIMKVAVPVVTQYLDERKEK